MIVLPSLALGACGYVLTPGMSPSAAVEPGVEHWFGQGAFPHTLASAGVAKERSE